MKFLLLIVSLSFHYVRSQQYDNLGDRYRYTGNKYYGRETHDSIISVPKNVYQPHKNQDDMYAPGIAVVPLYQGKRPIQTDPNQININQLKNLIQYGPAVQSHTPNDNYFVTCTNGILNVTGTDIYLSNATSGDTINEYCGNQILNAIFIAATNNFYIDTDLLQNFFRPTSILIIASNWIIIGSKTIHLEGFAGSVQSNTAPAGQDGEPGRPGGNGGNFIGYGFNFTGLENLSVIVNGGDGGNGQNGGNGLDGKDGLDGAQQFQGFNPFPFDKEEKYDKVWRTGYKNIPIENGKWIEDRMELKELKREHCYTDIKFYTRDGKCGTEGGRGGNGGVGGYGGKSGDSHIFYLPDFVESNQYKKSANPGSIGKPGVGGLGGYNGKPGKTVTCVKIFVNNDDVSYTNTDNFWRCLNVSDNIDKCPPSNLIGAIGQDNFVTDGIQSPPENKSYDFSSVIEYFTNSLITQKQIQEASTYNTEIPPNNQNINNHQHYIGL